MNPLNRRMFRQPGMSRQPAGILASSPQLANTVANRQPVRMANGGTNTYTAAVQRAVQAGDKRALQELAKPVNYGAAARTPDGQNALRLARQAIAQSTRISTAPKVDTSGPRPDVVKRARDMASIASQDRTESTPLINNPPSASAMDQIKRAFMYPGEVLGFGVPDDAPGKPNPIGQGIRNFVFGTEESQSPVQSALRSADDAIVRGTSAAGDAIQNLEKGIISGFIPKPTGTALADAQAEAGAVRESFPGRSAGTATVSDMEGGVAQGLPLAGEQLAENNFGVSKVKVSSDGEPAPKLLPLPKPFKENVNKSKLEKLLTKAQDGTITESKVNLNAAEAATPEAAKALELVLPEKTSLSDMEAEAKKIMGFDPSKAKGKRQDAFWRNLTMAGLAIAAGESANALTNVAKGLMVGLDSYSKDIKDLDEADAAERKEYRATLRDLIKTDKDEKIAMATLKNNFNFKMTELEQSKNQFESEMAYKERESGLRNNLANKQLEVQITSALATLDLREDTLDETKQQNAITNSINKLKNQPQFVQNAIALDLGSMNEDGAFEWNDKGEKWKNDNTDLIMRSALVKSTGKETNTDQLATAYQQQFPILTSNEARILADAVQGKLSDYGTVEEAIKQVLGEDVLQRKERPTTQQGTQGLAVGSVVTQGGKKFRVTAVDAQGNVTGSEEIK